MPSDSQGCSRRDFYSQEAVLFPLAVLTLLTESLYYQIPLLDYPETAMSYASALSIFDSVELTAVAGC